MRIGLREMRVFSKLIFPSVRDATFFESCGVADVITTCCMCSMYIRINKTLSTLISKALHQVIL